MNWKYCALRKVRQQEPITLVFDLEIDGEPAGTKNLTATLRSINDSIFAATDSAESLDEGSGQNWTDYGWSPPMSTRHTRQ